jgi:hypothetical protein
MPWRPRARSQRPRASRAGVVYSATSRLSASGKLERVPKPDGQVGYRVKND